MRFGAEMFVAIDETFALRHVNAAMGAGDHALWLARRVARRTGRPFPTLLPCPPRHGNQCEEQQVFHRGYPVFIVTNYGGGRESGRSDMIRTCDPCVPNAVLYQAELHSDVVQEASVIPLDCKECQL